MSEPSPPPVLKAELHCHLEGALAPAFARRLAARHGLALEVEIGADGAYVWQGFQEFIRAYDAAAHVLVTPADYADHLVDYYSRAAAQGLIYGEMFVSLDHGLAHGASYPDFIARLAEGIDRVRTAHGVEVRLILTAVRHLGAEAAERTARYAHTHPHPYVTGFGLAGDENYGRPADFARAFGLARDAGLGLTAHAGELAGPESVRAAVADLGVSRIGHGVRAGEDPDLVAWLVDRGVTLEVCPSSNLALGLYPDLARHPIEALRRAGCKVTLSTDDPAFFHCDIEAEYARTAAAFGWPDATLRDCTANAIAAAFCPPEVKAALATRLARAAGAAPNPEAPNPEATV